MFKQVIRNTMLTTDTANGFFQHICGESFLRDLSFLSTLRALVAPRMKEGESLYLSFSQSSYTKETLSSTSAKRAVEAVCDVEDCDNGRILVHNFTGGVQEDNYAWMELMKSSFEGAYPGWHRMDKVTEFFRKTFYVLCFINPEKKSVVIFTDSMDVRKMHYLQCSIFAFLPWYFDPKEGVSALEMELINSLREKDSQAYEGCIARIAEQYDFRTARIRQLLSGFEIRYERMECDRVRRDIESCLRQITNLNDQIGSYLQTKNEHEIRLLGLEAKIASNSSDDSEIMEYFLCNDKLVLESVNDTTMTFIVKTYLEYFDEDMAKRMIDNAQSFIYRPDGTDHSGRIPAEDMKKLMYAIFIDQKMRIKFCAAYVFNLNGNVSVRGGYNYGAEFGEYMPNTHIDKYTCLGNYSRAINECLKRRNYIGAIEQCVASCKSLNFGDSPVMTAFMKGLYGTVSPKVNNRCIELPDGKVVTPKEAIEWIKAQEAETNE